MLTVLQHILKNQQNENGNEHLRFYILRFSLFKGLGNVGYYVHWAPLSLSETDSPVCGWYHALSSKPPLHCGSRWSGRSWTPSSPPYLCSTIKSNWWLIISHRAMSQIALCPVASCNAPRWSGSTVIHQIHQVRLRTRSTLCVGNSCAELTPAECLLAGCRVSIIKTGYSGALILLVVERLLILERFQRENDIKRVWS